MRERQRESAKTSPWQGANDEANVSINEQRKPSFSLSKCISFSKDAKRQSESPRLHHDKEKMLEEIVQQMN